jgi:hypothetical protein
MQLAVHKWPAEPAATATVHGNTILLLWQHHTTAAAAAATVRVAVRNCACCACCHWRACAAAGKVYIGHCHKCVSQLPPLLLVLLLLQVAVRKSLAERAATGVRVRQPQSSVHLASPIYSDSCCCSLQYLQVAVRKSLAERAATGVRVQQLENITCGF